MTIIGVEGRSVFFLLPFILAHATLSRLRLGRWQRTVVAADLFLFFLPRKKKVFFTMVACR